MRYEHKKFDQAVKALDLASYEEVGVLLIGMGIVEVEPDSDITPWWSKLYCCRCPIAQYFRKLGFSMAYVTRSFAGIDIKGDDDHGVCLPDAARDFIIVHDRMIGW